MELHSPPTSPQRGGRPASRLESEREDEEERVVLPQTLLQRVLREASRRENAEVRGVQRCRAHAPARPVCLP